MSKNISLMVMSLILGINFLFHSAEATVEGLAYSSPPSVRVNTTSHKPVKLAAENMVIQQKVAAEADDVLLAQAIWWASRNRDELAKESLIKLLSAAPNNADGLVLLIELETRNLRLEAAQTALDSLRQNFANHPAIARLGTLIRITSRDKVKLQHIRQLERNAQQPGHLKELEQAMQAFRALYPDGAPDGDLALEYLQMQAATPNGWASAYDELSQLVRANPGNLRYWLALVINNSFNYPDDLPLTTEQMKDVFNISKQAVQHAGSANSKWTSLTKVAQFWQLMDEGRVARAAKDFVLAANKLNLALKIKPLDPDAIAALGDVQADRGQLGTAINFYRHALSIAPLNRNALEGLINAYHKQDALIAQLYIAELTVAQRKVASQLIAHLEVQMAEEQASNPEGFLSALSHFPADKRPANLSRSWGATLERFIEKHAQSVYKDGAKRLLQKAESLAEQDEEATYSVAIAWGELGDYQQADKIFNKLKAVHQPPSTRWHLRYAYYLNIKKAPELRAELDTIASIKSLTLEETQKLLELQEALAIRTAKKQLE